jgi:hypothetical protein
LLQNQRQTYGDNLNNVKRETSKLQEKQRGYLKEEINELETKSKKKSIKELHRGLYESEKGY